MQTGWPAKTRLALASTSFWKLAAFSATKDPFLVLTSNCFAILGLRAIYFAVAAITAICSRERPVSCSTLRT